MYRRLDFYHLPAEFVNFAPEAVDRGYAICYRHLVMRLRYDRFGRRVATWVLAGWLLAWPAPSAAIEVTPTPEHVRAALERGQAAAKARKPPTELYAWFGGTDEWKPRGFLMTKLSGLTVMAAHFALRSEQPTAADIRQILDETTMLVSATIYGDRPAFARDSYLVMTQGARTIKPLTVRFDGQAQRTSAWPGSPAYQAKVVASFAYTEFDPRTRTRISVFPPVGGEVAFDVDFARLE